MIWHGRRQGAGGGRRQRTGEAARGASETAARGALLELKMRKETRAGRGRLLWNDAAKRTAGKVRGHNWREAGSWQSRARGDTGKSEGIGDGEVVSVEAGTVKGFEPCKVIGEAKRGLETPLLGSRQHVAVDKALERCRHKHIHTHSPNTGASKADTWMHAVEDV